MSQPCCRSLKRNEETAAEALLKGLKIGSLKIAVCQENVLMDEQIILFSDARPHSLDERKQTAIFPVNILHFLFPVGIFNNNKDRG